MNHQSSGLRYVCSLLTFSKFELFYIIQFQKELCMNESSSSYICLFLYDAHPPAPLSGQTRTKPFEGTAVLSTMTETLISQLNPTWHHAQLVPPHYKIYNVSTVNKEIPRHTGRSPHREVRLVTTTQKQQLNGPWHAAAHSVWCITVCKTVKCCIWCCLTQLNRWLCTTESEV